MKLYKPIISLFLLSIFALVTTTAFAVNVTLSAEEKRLYNLVNEYRAQNGLSAIPLSSSLTYVAQTHVKDLHNSPPTGVCNMHSWSQNGTWSSCCYTSDHAKAQCMWDKPRELTNYSGNGFENAFGGSDGYIATAQNALEGWKHSQGHNTVILNQGNWANITWKALGVGLYKGYAVLWFGQEVDSANPVTTTPTTQVAQITFENKSNIIFDLVEKDYAQYFFPATGTQVSGSGNEIQYWRIYSNEYQAALITKENHLWYGFYGELYHFGTLDEANQQLCKNKCW